MLTRPENAFLKSLSDSAFALVAGHLTPCELFLAAHVQDTAVPAAWVYFPVTSLLSTIVLGDEGESVEASMVGVEGAAGLAEACGSRVSAVDCIVQVGGSAWRSPSSALHALVSSSPNFAERAWRAAELQLAEARQSGLCHAMHPIERRLARWLLESMERSGNRNPLPMTQEFLSAMLGVQRTTVTGLALKMQELGLIRYSRGQLTVIDPMRLEGLACGCRKAMQDQRTRLGFPIAAVTTELV